MTNRSMDRHARKQVLLTRIAFDRTQLQNDLSHVGKAVRLPRLLRGVVGGRIARSLFGAASARATEGGWAGLAWSLWRRYRVTAALVGGAAPIIRGRGGWRRLARVAGLGAAAWFSWHRVLGRDRPRD